VRIPGLETRKAHPGIRYRFQSPAKEVGQQTAPGWSGAGPPALEPFTSAGGPGLYFLPVVLVVVGAGKFVIFSTAAGRSTHNTRRVSPTQVSWLRMRSSWL
jgi:hypothetical protein